MEALAEREPPPWFCEAAVEAFRAVCRDTFERAGRTPGPSARFAQCDRSSGVLRGAAPPQQGAWDFSPPRITSPGRAETGAGAGGQSRSFT